jgi:hypothetical protein
MGLFNSNKSSNTTNQSTNNYVDGRSVVDASGGGIAGDRNTVINDSGAVKVAEFNSQLLQAVSEDQTASFRNLVGGAADMYRVSGANQLKAWETTIGGSTALFGKAIDAVAGAASESRSLAATAIGAYQPADNKASDTVTKVAFAVVAGLALFFIMRKT